LGSVRAKKFVSFYGEAGHAVAGSLEQGSHMLVGADDVCPDGLLLKRVEDEPAVAGGMVLPCRAEKGLPVKDGGRGPGNEAFGTALAMVGGGKSACGALTGGDDETASTQPCGDFVSILRPR